MMAMFCCVVAEVAKTLLFAMERTKQLPFAINNMLNAILFLLGGILAGRLFRKQLAFFKHLTKAQTVAIILMLFSLGLSVGVNHSVMDNLSSLGLQALIISFLCMGGSILVAWLFWKVMFWRKGK